MPLKSLIHARTFYLLRIILDKLKSHFKDIRLKCYAINFKKIFTNIEKQRYIVCRFPAKNAPISTVFLVCVTSHDM